MACRLHPRARGRTGEHLPRQTISERPIQYSHRSRMSRKPPEDAPREGGAGQADGEAGLKAIVDQMVDGIVIVDAEGEFCYVNSAAEALFERPAQELLGEPFGFPVMAGESTEIEVIRRSSAVVVAELRAAEIEWNHERALLISLRDVTDRKQAEEQARELAREQAARVEAEAAEGRYRRLAEEKSALAEENAVLYRKAEEGSRAKSEFLAMMSHELRTPLNAIIGYTDLMIEGLSGPVSQAQHEQLGRVKASSRHLLELVDEVLTFSRLEAGRDDVHAEPVDYLNLTHEVAALVRPLVEEKHLSLQVSVPQGPCRGETDAPKLRQILLNLLSNATKFTEEGGVWLELAAEGDEVVFVVRDTGIGIPQERLKQIWEPFNQVDRSHTRTVDGTGLGLSVARRLTTLLGGSVSVHSLPGRGSTFTVRVPRRLDNSGQRQGSSSRGS